MTQFRITSNYGHIHFGPFYVGWNNDNVNGDETFGIAIGNFYVGHYTDGKWCAGFLNEYGCLN